MPNTSSDKPSSVTRRHFLHDHSDEGAARLISVIGCKLTTASSLARECARTIGLAVEEPRSVAIGPGTSLDPMLDQEVLDIARAGSVSEETARGMMEWHGKRAMDMARMALVSAELRAPICPHTSHIVAEVAQAYRKEFAMTLGDALLRRVPVALGACWSESCSREAALRIGAVMGWNEHDLGENLESFETESRTASSCSAPLEPARRWKRLPTSFYRWPLLCSLLVWQSISKRLTKQCVSIRNNLPIPRSAKRFSLRRSVHCPDHAFLLCILDLAQDRGKPLDEPVMQNQVVDGSMTPMAELCRGFTDEPERNGRIFCAEMRQQFRIKRRDDKSTLRWKTLQKIQRDLFQSRHLEFNIEECRVLKAREHVRKAGQMGKLISSRLANHHALSFGIVPKDDLSVRSKANIELKTIAPVSERPVE